MQIPHMPFKILVLAPFKPWNTNAWDQAPIRVTGDEIDQVMADLGLWFTVPLPAGICPAGELDLRVSRFKDLAPDHLAAGTPYLQHLQAAAEFLADARQKGMAAKDIKDGFTRWPDLPEFEFESMAPKAKRPASNAIDDILNMVALPGEESGSTVPTAGGGAQIDNILQNALSQLYADENLRMLESTWRALRFLLRQKGVNGDIQVQIVPAATESLDTTIDALTAHLLDDLPSLILVDFGFDSSAHSLTLLAKVAEFAETLMAPAVAWATPGFFKIDSWDELGRLPFLPHYLEDAAFGQWQSLKASSAARWLALTANRFLLREPYGPDNRPRQVRMKETQNLWASPTWALGCLATQSFATVGWATHLTDIERIRLDNLPLDTSDPAHPLPTETALTRDRIDQFIRAGLMPLVAARGQDIAFAPAQTTVAGESLSYQLFASRVTQFILWCKDNFQRDLTADELQTDLAQAITRFWENSGHGAPDQMHVSAAAAGSDGRIPLRIEVAPMRDILSSGRSLVMEFGW